MGTLRTRLRRIEKEAQFRRRLDFSLSLDKILYSSEINSLRNFLSRHSAHEFKPCSVLCGFIGSSFPACARLSARKPVTKEIRELIFKMAAENTNAPPELIATPGSCRADQLIYAQRYLLLPAMQLCRGLIGF
jgi:hypothetical protein